MKRNIPNFIVKPLTEQEWNLVRILVEKNDHDLEIPDEITNDGWFTAKAICNEFSVDIERKSNERHSFFKQSPTNVHTFAKGLIRKHLVEGKKISYFGKGRHWKRSHEKKMYRLKRTPFFRYQIFRLFFRKSPEDIDEITKLPYFEGSWQKAWFIKGIDKEIERFEYITQLLIHTKKGVLLSNKMEQISEETKEWFKRTKPTLQKLLQNKKFRDSKKGKEWIDWFRQMKKLNKKIKSNKQTEVSSKK